MGKYLTKHATAGKEVGHPWAKASAKSWTDWLIGQSAVWKKSAQGIEFVVLGGTLLYCFEDRIRISSPDEKEPEVFRPDSVKRIQLTPTHLRILQKAGPIEFPRNKFSDIDYFLWLVKDWYGWETSTVKK